MAIKPVKPLLIRVVVPQKWSPEKEGEAEGCQDTNKQMQQTNKQTLLANTETDGTKEGTIVIKLDEEFADEKEGKAVEREDQRCLKCGENNRKVPNNHIWTAEKNFWQENYFQEYFVFPVWPRCSLL